MKNHIINNILPKEKEFQVQPDGEYHFGENQKVIGYNSALNDVYKKVPEIVEYIRDLLATLEILRRWEQ